MRRIVLYIGIAVLVVGGFLAYWLYQEHRQNVEAGDRMMMQQAGQMNKLVHSQ